MFLFLRSLICCEGTFLLRRRVWFSCLLQKEVSVELGLERLIKLWLFLKSFCMGEAFGNYNLFWNRNQDITIPQIYVFHIEILVWISAATLSVWLLFNNQEQMRNNFKLFLGNQRTKQGQPLKLKAKNSKSFRMRTHNAVQQIKDLSARQYNFGSCQLPDSSQPTKPPFRELYQKLSIDPLLKDKHFPNDQKRSKNACEVQHNHFKVLFSNREPLRFLKPQLRYRSESESVVGRKNELYRQINNPKIFKQPTIRGALIQYSTQFNQSAQKEVKKLKKEEKPKSGRVSLNVLRSKLKNRFKI